MMKAVAICLVFAGLTLALPVEKRSPFPEDFDLDSLLGSLNIDLDKLDLNGLLDNIDLDKPDLNGLLGDIDFSKLFDNAKGVLDGTKIDFDNIDVDDLLNSFGIDLDNINLDGLLDQLNIDFDNIDIDGALDKLTNFDFNGFLDKLNLDFNNLDFNGLLDNLNLDLDKFPAKFPFQLPAAGGRGRARAQGNFNDLVNRAKGFLGNLDFNSLLDSLNIDLDGLDLNSLLANFDLNSVLDDIDFSKLFDNAKGLLDGANIDFNNLDLNSILNTLGNKLDKLPNKFPSDLNVHKASRSFPFAMVENEQAQAQIAPVLLIVLPFLSSAFGALFARLLQEIGKKNDDVAAQSLGIPGFPDIPDIPGFPWDRDVPFKFPLNLPIVKSQEKTSLFLENVLDRLKPKSPSSLFNRVNNNRKKTAAIQDKKKVEEDFVLDRLNSLFGHKF